MFKRKSKQSIFASATKGTAIDYSGGDVSGIDYDAVYVGGAGDLVVTTKEGSSVTFTGLTAGSILPVAIIGVTQTGSTATALVGLTW